MSDFLSGGRAAYAGLAGRFLLLLLKYNNWVSKFSSQAAKCSPRFCVLPAT